MLRNRVKVADTPVAVNADDGIAGGGENLVETSLALFKGLPGTVQLVDLDVGAEPLEDRSRLIPDRNNACKKGAKDSIGSAQGEDHLEGLLRLNRVLPALDDGRENLRIVDRLPAPAFHRFGYRTGVLVPAAVVPEDRAIDVSHPGEGREGVDEGLEASFALLHESIRDLCISAGGLKVGDRLALVQQADDLAGESFKGGDLLWRQHARLGVDDADSAEDISAFFDDGGAGVKADVWIAENKGVVSEADVGGCVFDDESLRVVDGVRAEALRTWRLVGAETNLGLEPLTLFIDERDQRDRGSADKRRQLGDVVVALLRE